MSSEQIAALRNMAKEIAAEGHNGWPNAAADAADTMQSLLDENERLEEVVEAAKQTIKECGEMDFDHTKSCWNWAACEDSRRQCALCDLRDVLAKLEKSND